MTRVRLPRNAMRFDKSVGSYVKITNNASLDITDEITVQVLVKPIKDSGIYQMYIGKRYYEAWAIGTHFDFSKFRWYLSVNGSFYSQNYGDITPNKWYFLTMTYSSYSGEWYAYLNTNKQLLNTLSGKIDTSSIDLHVGCDVGVVDPTYHSNAWISLVLIYNRALTEDEIRWNYEHLDNPITDGLVLWLGEDSVGSNTWQDLSGKGNDGTVYGATPVDVRPWTASRIQNTFSVNNYSRLKVAESTRWLKFDGVDDYVEVSDNSSLRITNEITIIAHIKRKGDGIGTWQGIVDKYSYLNGGYALFYQADFNEFSFYLRQDTTTFIDLRCPSILNEDVVIIGTYDGDNAKIYKNGILVDSTTRSMTLGIYTGSLNIGSWASNYFEGNIAKILIYNRSFTQDDVDWINMHLDDPIKDGLVLWLDEDSISGNNWKDKSGNGNDGTIYGAIYESR